MKKIISLILIAILCLGVLTSCAQLGGVVDSIKDKLGMGGEQPAEGPSLDDAASFLHKIYKDKKETTRTDFDVVAVVAIDGVKFPVAWTSDNDKVVIRESTKTGYYTVDLPDVNNEEFSYTLTATISNADGETASKSYTFKVPVIDNSGITSTPVEGVAYKLFLLQGNENRRYYALNTTQENKFINTTLNPKDGAEFFVEKVDGGYKVYTEVNGVKNYIYVNVTRTESEDGTVKYSKFIGFSTENASVLSYNEKMGGTWTTVVHDLVWGIGTYGSYTTISVSEGSYFTPEKVGSSQFVMQFITAEYANTLEEDKLPDSPSDAEGILNQLYALADGEQAIGSFTLTGKITALDNYNNPTIVVEGFENMPVYCFKLAVENKVGDTITVTATTMKNYGGTYEFMNCTLVSGGNQGGTTTDPETPTDSGFVTNPQVGVAYKFGLFHGNENATVFFNGQNYNNYAWYLAYAATGVDVYLEAVDGVEGGYRLYFMNGDAKTYIRVYQDSRSGHENDGTIELTTSVPEEYFTFNTEYNTLIWTNANGAESYLGSSGTYTSISCSNISYITNENSYISHLYVADATGGEGGSDTPVDPTPDTPVSGDALTSDKVFVSVPVEEGGAYPSYSNYNGNYTCNGFNITTVDVLRNSHGVPYVFQFKKNTGAITVSNATVNSITIVLVTSYDTFSTPVVTLGGTELTYDSAAVMATKESTGTNNSSNYEVFRYTITIVLDAATTGDLVVKNTSGYAMYLESIAIDGTSSAPETPVDPQPPVHEHTFVEGKCECGETDPDYVAPSQPETPAASGVEVGKAYIITANNANGAIYVSNSVSSGRFNAVTSASSATKFYVENASGGFILYFLNGATKNYVVMTDTSTGGSFTTDSSAASVFEWNETLKTLEVADDENARGFATDPSKTYTNFSCYAVSNGTKYSWGQFVVVE